MDLDSLFKLAGWDPKHPANDIVELVSDATAHWRSPVFFEELITYLIYYHIPLRQGKISEKDVKKGKISKELSREVQKDLPTPSALYELREKIFKTDDVFSRITVLKFTDDICHAYNMFRDRGELAALPLGRVLEQDFLFACKAMDSVNCAIHELYCTDSDFREIEKGVKERLLSAWKVHHPWKPDQGYYLSACFVIWLFKEDRTKYYVDLTPEDVDAFSKGPPKREVMAFRKEDMGSRAF